MEECLACKICGAPLAAAPGELYAVCGSCGSVVNLPYARTQARWETYERAYTLWRAGRFEKAAALFDALSTQEPRDAEAFWGLALCLRGIRYAAPESGGEYAPVFQRDAGTPFSADENVQRALARAEGFARQLYEKQARRIDEAQSPARAAGAGTEAGWIIDADGKRQRSFLHRTLRAMLVAVPITAACLAVLVLVLRVLVPAVNYRNAGRLLAAGEYGQAAALYERLGDYRDAPEQAQSAQAAQEAGTGDTQLGGAGDETPPKE